MKQNKTKMVVAILLLAYSGAVAIADTLGKVQPDPTKPCPAAKPHQLCFAQPDDGVARAEYLSEPYYAVMLKTAERCSITEDERLAAQSLFANSKVFSVRFECGDDEDTIHYTNVNEKFGFLAVYAGLTLKDAKKRLREVRATGRFPGANIRKMQARLIYP